MDAPPSSSGAEKKSSIVMSSSPTSKAVELSNVIDFPNPDGHQITQTIVIGEQANDLFLTNRSLEVYDGFCNDMPAKMHISNGTRTKNKKMMDMYNNLCDYSDDNVLYIYAVKEVDVPLNSQTSSSSKTAVILASENYHSNLENLVLAGTVELFTQGANGKFDMNERLRKIVRDIGVTFQQMQLSRTHYFRNIRLKDIFLHVQDEEYNIKLGYGISKGVKSNAPLYLAIILKEIFELAERQPSDTLSDFIMLLENLVVRTVIPGCFFKHPIFLSWEEKIILICDVATLYVHPYPEHELGGKYTWPNGSVFDAMVNVRRGDKKSTFLHFVVFVRDKLLSDFADLNHDVVGDTKEKFLAYVTDHVPYFWTAIGRLVVAKAGGRESFPNRRWRLAE